jgi:hypothetical protein
MANPREATPRQTQGLDEQIARTIVTTSWGGSPTSVSFKVYDVGADYQDVTVTVMPGTATVSGDTITLPKLISLTERHLYRVEVKFTSLGNVFETWFEVLAER